MNPMDVSRTIANGMDRALSGQNPNMGSPSDLGQGGFNGAARQARGNAQGAKNNTGNSPNSSASNASNGGATGHNGGVGGGDLTGGGGGAYGKGSIGNHSGQGGYM